MLMTIESGLQRGPRWAVYAYDISCPKRAAAARATLAPRAGPRQYSVWECRLYPSWANDLLVELSATINADEDLLAMWWPRRGARISMEAGGRSLARNAAGAAIVAGADERRQLLAGAGNYIVSYDVSSPKTSQRIHAVVAAGGVMVQRSVYQWRCPAQVIERLLETCGQLLDPGDRFWVHPLAEMGDLWRVGESASAVLPIARHHWRTDRASDAVDKPT